MPLVLYSYCTVQYKDLNRIEPSSWYSTVLYFLYTRSDLPYLATY